MAAHLAKEPTMYSNYDVRVWRPTWDVWRMTSFIPCSLPSFLFSHHDALLNQEEKKEKKSLIFKILKKCA